MKKHPCHTHFIEQSVHKIKHFCTKPHVPIKEQLHQHGFYVKAYSNIEIWQGNDKESCAVIKVKSILPLRWRQMQWKVSLTATCLNDPLIHLMLLDEPCVPLLALWCCSVCLPACLPCVYSAVCSHAQRRQGCSRCPPPPPPSSAIAVIYAGPLGCQRCSCTLLSERVPVQTSARVMRVHAEVDLLK